MARSFAAFLTFAAVALAVPSPVTPDPAGTHNVGNGQGAQFITGACLSTADCSQAVVHSCCAFIAGGAATGICSGFDVANVNGKAGCGFGDGGSAAASAAPAASTQTATDSTTTDSTTDGSTTTSSGGTAAQCAVDTSLAGSQNVGTGAAAQFITGQCFSSADCASGCCVAQASGVALCKAQLVTEQAGLTCDFSCSGASSSSSLSASSSPPTSASDATSSTDTGNTDAGTCAVDSSLAGSQNVGTGAGTQFITGQCFSPADCASGCCVAQPNGVSLCKAQLVTEQAGLSCSSTCSGATSATVDDSGNDSGNSSSSSSGDSSTADAVTGQAGSAQCTVNASLAGSQNVGTGAATQFITGQCFSSADCASGCCVAQPSGAALCKAQLVTQQAGLSCDFTCSA
ncbi:hypothetical protein SPI_02259 [Niveomyces insectorum RCEF 264]|uniref:Biotrophy-associated secreted protein 2 n=1 Tax=Niveomyces insectorum RCEF 264 TaxID=1081102 RepID=A0A162J8X0_9HYPO|nr:hypothetical protein SPI_02259 [Niveomyces insectorum RCEF 264]